MGVPMPSIAIIGSGFGGLAAAITLLHNGITDITVFERSTDVGGVWRENAYPGAACDVPSPYYSFSFAPNPYWPRRYAPQSSILDYLRRVADLYGVRDRIEFNTAVTAATFDSETNEWVLQTDKGTRRFDVLVPAVGQLSQPILPTIPGIETFRGPAFHTAHWDPTVDLAGKNVAVVGTGASAIQVVPQIQPTVAALTVFQRSPTHIAPRPDRGFGAAHQWLHRIPLTDRPRRGFWKIATEALTAALHYSPAATRALQAMLFAYMRVQAGVDRALFDKLWPDHPIGCKRILFSNNYIPALKAANTTLETDPITEIVADGIVTATGRHHEVDAIVYGTGFAATEFLAPLTITGVDGTDLTEAWRDGARAYLGMTVPGFPNMFIVYGPNTNLGSGSIVAMLECQAHYLTEAVQHLPSGAAFDVYPGVEATYDRELQLRLGRSVWAGCDSWYRAESGRVVSNWPGTIAEYRRRTNAFDVTHYAVRAGVPAPQTSH
ncbi:4-hydroxyacetophenone monooxygenase [Mycolicibacterium llatzerense]|nr:4-hydroxyacetophenone monooxygenase [Mycolicibacterium llatzerense]